MPPSPPARFLAGRCLPPACQRGDKGLRHQDTGFSEGGGPEVVSVGSQITVVLPLL